jgi:hypothetical protein
VTGLSDTAALAAIGAAARELKRPPCGLTPARLAEIAVRNGRPTWPTRQLLSAEIDDRAGRRRARIAEARFPRIRQLADFDTDGSPASPHRSPPWPPVPGSTSARLCCSATPAPARPRC